MAAVRIQEVAAWVESMRRNLNDDAVVVFVTHGDLIAKLLNLLVTNRSGSGSGVGTVGGGKSADVNASAALSFQGIRNTSVSYSLDTRPFLYKGLLFWCLAAATVAHVNGNHTKVLAITMWPLCALLPCVK